MDAAQGLFPDAAARVAEREAKRAQAGRKGSWRSRYLPAPSPAESLSMRLL